MAFLSIMSQKLKKQHINLALHNEQACGYLNNSNHYFDWVITSAFYAALHFVSAVIFPVEYDNEGEKETVNDIGTYRDFVGSRENKHKLMTDLVYSNCRGIGYSYRALLDLSYAARYETTCHARLYSDKARHYMGAIKTYCFAVSHSNDAGGTEPENRLFNTRH